MNLSDLWEKIKIIFGEMWPILWPHIKIILTKNGKAALDAAMRIVREVQAEYPHATGAEKINIVLARLTTALTLQGISMGVEMLRSIIKIAYEHMIADEATIAEAKEFMLVVATTVPPTDAAIPEWVK